MESVGWKDDGEQSQEDEDCPGSPDEPSGAARLYIYAGMRCHVQAGLTSQMILEVLDAGLHSVDLGIGLHNSLIRVLDEQIDQDVNNGYGLLERIGQGQNLFSGEILGFEPLGFYAMSFHSWICCGFPEERSGAELGVQPAANGFISNLPDAIRMTEYIRRQGVEPGIWLPWMIVRYAVE